MAIVLQSAGGNANTNYAEFYCDTVDDISSLPTMTRSGLGEYSIYGACPMSSACYVITTGAIYLLGSTGWIPQ